MLEGLLQLLAKIILTFGQTLSQEGVLVSAYNALTSLPMTKLDIEVITILRNLVTLCLW